MKQYKYKITDEQLRKEYDLGNPMSEVAAKYKMTNVTIWRRAKKLGLKWSDLKNNKGGNAIPLNEILDGLHPYYQTFKLKNRLLIEGIKLNICEMEDCNLSEWKGKPINIQLDHIDGNSHNHLLENLRMVCPNCHSQTETYCGKNRDKKSDI